MSPQEIKAELSLDVADAARFFRNFADALEGGDEKALNEFGISIKESKKIKLGVKRRLDSISLKIKVKNQLPAAEGGQTAAGAAAMPDPAKLDKILCPPKGDSDILRTASHTRKNGDCAEKGSKKPGYKTLKKRLAKSFKNMKKSLLAASPPTAVDLALFVENSAKMLNYQGYGDEYYAAYADACKAFEKAVSGGDLQEMLTAFNKIGELKAACHNRYK